MNKNSKKFNWIKNGLVLLLSTAFAISITEVLLRVAFPNTPTFGTYSSRYVVDGNPSYISGITRSNPYMPFSMRPNYSHMFTDLAYHPKPYKISLDSYGYRNSVDYKEYDNVVVGDSVAYGAGVDNDQMLSNFLGQNKKVYNLAISGAGPGMYMKMMDTFLKKRKTDKFTILFFLGNDLRNLSGACWDELANCKPPLNSKIRRKDVSAVPDSPPLILANPLIRNSYIAHYLFMFLKNSQNKDKAETVKLKEIHAMISRKVVTDIKNYFNRNNFIESNKHNSIRLLKLLLKSKCLNNDITILINEVINNIKNGKVDNIFDNMKNITQHFINADCYPIGNEMQNIVTYANYFAGFYYESMDSIRLGYKGNLFNYLQMLKIVGTTYSDLKEEANNLAKAILEMEELANIEFLTASLQQKLNYKEQDDSCFIADNCKKIDIFLDYLASLRNQGINISIYLIPAEHQLQRRLRRPEVPHSIHGKATEKGIHCVDLTKNFLQHYTTKGNNALFLDGAHLTKEGNKLVANWITQYETN